MTSNTRSALSLRKRDNNSCKLICLSFVSFFKQPFLYRPYFSMTRSRMASRIPLLCVSAIENVAENDFDRGGGSDNFFEILFMQKTKSKTDVLPSLYVILGHGLDAGSGLHSGATVIPTMCTRTTSSRQRGTMDQVSVPST